jgi:hypothetical protein
MIVERYTNIIYCLQNWLRLKLCLVLRGIDEIDDFHEETWVSLSLFLPPRFRRQQPNGPLEHDLLARAVKVLNPRRLICSQNKDKVASKVHLRRCSGSSKLFHEISMQAPPVLHNGCVVAASFFLPCSQQIKYHSARSQAAKPRTQS